MFHLSQLHLFIPFPVSPVIKVHRQPHWLDILLGEPGPGYLFLPFPHKASNRAARALILRILGVHLGIELNLIVQLHSIGILAAEHNAVVFYEHMDVRAVLNTKLHEHILGPVVPQGPGMLPCHGGSRCPVTFGVRGWGRYL